MLPYFALLQPCNYQGSKWNCQITALIEAEEKKRDVLGMSSARKCKLMLETLMTADGMSVVSFPVYVNNGGIVQVCLQLLRRTSVSGTNVTQAH